MRRPVSWPTTRIVRPIPGWLVDLPAYQDYIFPRLTPFKTAVLVDRPVNGLHAVDRFLKDWLDVDLLRPAVDIALVALQSRSKRSGSSQS